MELELCLICVDHLLAVSVDVSLIHVACWHLCPPSLPLPLSLSLSPSPPLSLRFSVVRGGNTIEVTHADLVVGDIAEFKYGNTFPVDGILVQVGS